MRAKQHVRIDTVYADARFAAADVITALEQHHVRYVIVVPQRVRVKLFIQRMTHDVAVKHEHNLRARAWWPIECTPDVIDRYSRCMAIKNSYTTIKEFLVWTTSKNYCVRFFHFAFAVLLSDIWLLTDLVVKKIRGCDHHAPRLKATRFLNLDHIIVPVG